MATRQKRVVKRFNPIDSDMSDAFIPLAQPQPMEKAIVKKTGLVKHKKVSKRQECGWKYEIYILPIFTPPTTSEFNSFLSEQVEFNEPGMITTAMNEVLIDPRPRHKEELRALIEKTDELKAEREVHGKNKEGKKIRQKYTEQIAALEKEHRERCAQELQSYLSSLDEVGKKKEEMSALDKLRYKKSWHVSRNKHTMGKKR